MSCADTQTQSSGHEALSYDPAEDTDTHLPRLAAELVHDLRREPGLDTLLPLLPRVPGHVTRVRSGARLPAKDHAWPVRRTLGPRTGVTPDTALRLNGVFPSVGVVLLLLLVFLGSVTEILRLLAITKTWNMGTEIQDSKPQLVSGLLRFSSST